MKIKYFGHSCFKLSYENGPVLITDPFDPTVTFAPCAERCDAVLVSHDHFDHNYTSSLQGDFITIDKAGTYNVGSARVTAIACFHDEKGGALRGKNLMTRVDCEDLSIAHLGDLGHMPDEAQMERLKDLDVLMLPIGGTYTIDTPQAEALIKLLSPRHAIAMHFRTDAYEINITTCDAFARDMNAGFMPCEIELTRQSIDALPPVMVLSYQ